MVVLTTKMATKKKFTYEYPRAALTVDIVIFGVDLERISATLDVLLIRRAADPFAGMLALPGGFVEMDETLDQAAFRELKEETGIVPSYLEQLYTFSKVDRDPRERVISAAFFALVPSRQHSPIAGSDASQALWLDVNRLNLNKPKFDFDFAFDHKDILELAVKRLQAKIRYAPIGFDLLPKGFTLAQLQRLYEVILQKPLDRSNFRKKIESLDVLCQTGGTAPGRKAALYRFDKKKYEAAVQRGINFEV